LYSSRDNKKVTILFNGRKNVLFIHFSNAAMKPSDAEKNTNRLM